MAARGAASMTTENGKGRRGVVSLDGDDCTDLIVQSLLSKQVASGSDTPRSAKPATLTSALDTPTATVKPTTSPSRPAPIRTTVSMLLPATPPSTTAAARRVEFWE